MLDVAMSHAVLAHDQEVTNISSLEIKTTYPEPTRAGKLRVESWVVKKGYKIAFLEGHVYNEDNLLITTASSIGKVSRTKSAK